MDADYLDTGGLPYESSLAGDRDRDQPARRPSAAVIDAGLKTLSDDSGPARLVDAPGWTYQPRRRRARTAERAGWRGGRRDLRSATA